jgi:hypothetical protein
VAKGGVGYWAKGIWHPGYWHIGYWAGAPLVSADVTVEGETTSRELIESATSSRLVESITGEDEDG